MNLCIDIGNSIIKTALFSGLKIQETANWQKIGLTEIFELKSKYPEIKNVILCSVRPENLDLIDQLERNFHYLLVFNETTEIPLENLYRTSKTLGKDRLAAVTGANNNYPDKNVLVVDLGTAITYDLVDEFNCYLGGNISPGMTLRFRALHEFTGRLPLVQPKQKIKFMADNTEDAIAAGVEKGIIFEIESYINILENQYRNMIIIFTGGDAKYFDKKLKNTIFVDPFLIFTGLNRILIYNAENN